LRREIRSIASGKVENVVRLPLVPVSAATAEKIDAAMKSAGIIG